MKCQQGDLAKIIYSIRPQNVGLVVRVDEYIGKFEANEVFNFRGLACSAPVHDHYWFIACDQGLQTMYGESPKAYIPDSWLQPLPKESASQTERESLELDYHG